MINLVLNEEAEKLAPDLLDTIRHCIEQTLIMEEFPFDAEISFSITDNEGIRALNNEQRGIDRETDVLSFPMLEVEDGVLIVEDSDIFDNCVFLGDIVISLPKAKEQAEAYGHSFLREMGFLTVHSMLHLLGYDHELGEAEEKEMFTKQEEVLSALSLVR
ncbi:MAG: rRNA maturation RNase YbeY [Ruminococcaceae bacterium]|nr:rRNA maturation RNase YbeY [Oscillospiraceae bacterium]